jgi:hypothetical protein
LLYLEEHHPSDGKPAMNIDTLWALALLIYIVPFGIGQISYDDSLRAKKRLNPEQPVLENRRFLAIELLWAAGLGAFLLAWHLSR